MKTIVSVIVVALVGLEAIMGAEAGHLGDCFKPKPEAQFDFKGLSEYLAAKIATNDSEPNLGQLRADVASLKPEPLRRAAELTLELSEAKQCDDQVLELIKQAKEAGLRVDGDSRVEKVVEVHVNKLLDLCPGYIAESFEPKLQVPEIKEFLSVFGQKIVHEKGQLNYLLSQHGKEDANVACVGFQKMKKAQYNSIFETYLVQPCQKFVPLLGPTAEAYEAARGMHANYLINRAYDEKRPAFMLPLMRAMSVCRDVLNITYWEKLIMRESFCHYGSPK